MWLLIAAVVAAAVLLAKKSSASSSDTLPDGSGTSGPVLDPATLAAFNMEPWVPVYTSRVPAKPDGSVIAAHLSLPVGTTIGFGIMHGKRPESERPHLADVLGKIVVPHKADSFEPYTVNIVGILNTWRTSPGEKMPDEIGRAHV